MRKGLAIVTALMMVLMGIMVITPSAAATGYTYVTDLIADGGDGTGIVVGDVTVVNDGTTLHVTYETVNGWAITGTHLHVADSLIGIPQNKNGNPKVGHFEYGESFDPAVTLCTYDIDISGLQGEPIVATHAGVVHITEECLDIVSDASVEWLDPYDASGPTWKSAIPCWTHGSWPSITGATWIWRTLYTDPAWEYTNVPQYSTAPDKYGWLFERDFSLPDGAYDISGSIDITTDNGYELTVNANYIGGDGSMHKDGPDNQEWGTIETYDISSALSSGANTISIRALNWFSSGSSSSNPAGFTFKAHTCYKYVDQEESAWAAGEDFPGKNWATYIGDVTPTLIEMVTVPSDGSVVYSPTTLESSKTYVLEASGTYTYWPGASPYGIADAEYCYRPSSSYGPGWIYLEGISTPWPPSILDINVDGGDVYWGDYNSDHTYTLIYPGTGSPVSFQITDSGYGDNSGSLTVNIYEMP